MSTGEKIREIRIQKGLTQKQLGDKCGIADSNIRKYEKGKQNPKIETLQKISIALNCDISEFLTISDAIPYLRKDNTKETVISNLQQYLETLGYTILREEETHTIKQGFIDFELSEIQQESLEKFGYVMLHEKPYYIKKGKDAFRLTEKQFQDMENEVLSSIEFQLWKYRIKDI